MCVWMVACECLCDAVSKKYESTKWFVVMKAEKVKKIKIQLIMTIITNDL